jgi:hypothetical protein
VEEFFVSQLRVGLFVILLINERCVFGILYVVFFFFFLPENFFAEGIVYNRMSNSVDLLPRDVLALLLSKALKTVPEKTMEKLPPHERPVLRPPPQFGTSKCTKTC